MMSLAGRPVLGELWECPGTGGEFSPLSFFPHEADIQIFLKGTWVWQRSHCALCWWNLLEICPPELLRKLLSVVPGKAVTRVVSQ